MTLRRGHSAAAVASPPAPFNQVESRLLPELLRGLEERGDELCVLDLSAGSAGTVDFFANLQIHTRLIFLDVLEIVQLVGELRQTSDEDGGPARGELVKVWRNAIGLEASHRIDLVLLWDHLHRFDLAAVDALADALEPFVHEGSKGYGFGTLHSDTPIASYDYAIGGVDSVLLKPKPAETLEFAHSQQAIATHFDCMRIVRGTLLQEGHLELLLEA